ncbi:hypothetical protein [Synechococcus sp. BA-132 BA5]|uniref:hypothetical protein n=1 Tax=Synechococcus sp. BA-132 BA5 TaxID=3110252 RepID=UPI002B1F808D|nr:hypothetical protein [Synechococcus sp. BA-132 BA5]
MIHDEFPYRPQAQGGGGLQHPPIEAGQRGAAAVQRNTALQQALERISGGLTAL